MSKDKLETEREKIAKLENILIEALNTNSVEGYERISQIIEFTNKEIPEIKTQELQKATFISGPTGAGKSTLLNYLDQKDNLEIAKNFNGKFMLKAIKEISTIGIGKGSTTLFPKIWQPTDTSINTSFIDCAGEGDTGGVVTKAINALVKLKIGSNVEEAKLLFITSQASLEAQGSYGESFKKSLDINATFLGDINNHFQNNIAFVITHADRQEDNHGIVRNSIKTILSEHKHLDNYKQAVEQAMNYEDQNKLSRLVTFAKISEEEGKVGKEYQPPKSNLNQRETIIKMVNELPFAKIPKNFFKASFDDDVQKQMQKALTIVEAKMGQVIFNAVKDAMPIKIFSIELKPFAKYIIGLVKGVNTNWDHYRKILDWNNYLKVKFDKKEEDKLIEEMKFLSQFTNENIEEKDRNIKVLTKDWGKIANLKNGIFDKVANAVEEILHPSDKEAESLSQLDPNIHFTKVNMSLKEIIQVSSCLKEGGKLPELFKELKENYKNGNYSDKESTIKGINEIILKSKVDPNFKHLQMLNKDTVTIDSGEEQYYLYECLLRKWQAAEYVAYFTQYHNNSLDILEIEAIGNLVDPNNQL